MANRIRVRALRFGTDVGPSGMIFHGNPDSTEESVREPFVDERDLDYLIGLGLVEAMDRPKFQEDTLGITTPLVGVAVTDGDLAADLASPNAIPAEYVDPETGEVTEIPRGDGLAPDDPDAPPIASTATPRGKPGPKPEVKPAA